MLGRAGAIVWSASEQDGRLGAARMSKAAARRTTGAADLQR